MLKEPPEEPSIVRRDLFTVFFSLFNVFSWWYVIPLIIESILSGLQATYTQNTVVWVAYYSAIIGSNIVGSILSSQISKLNFLYLWTILGAVSTSLPALFSSFTVIHVLLISILLGASFGLGMPSCLAYFADCTQVENRGRIGGITFLVTNLSAPLFAISFGMLDLKINSLVFAIWRAFGLVVFFFLKTRERIVSKIKRKKAFTSILHNKFFALYFSACLMFCLVDSFERPILDYIFEDFHYITIAPIIGSVFTLIAGVFCDRIGRKRVLIYGFVTMGIAYAVIGIDPASLFSWYFFLTTESISWAIFYTTFILILWGDLSQFGNREKYYAIGVVPFLLSDIVRTLSAPYAALISTYSAFSVASVFLFLAILPLLYAPETLPERKIELRRLRKYVEKAKKLKEKYAATRNLE